MELPKNITQIGEADPYCKVFVEDYVVSHLKQLNAIAVDKELAVALYGVRSEENNITYLFLYGACRVNFLQKETRHLSQAQQQEIERSRKKYFREYTFLAYRLLNGEMIEGFHVCENGICRYVAGYSQFYEKNDTMLAYMLHVRQESEPETVEQDKYEEVRKRQEERKAIHQDQLATKKNAAGRSGKLRGAAVAAFVLLCALGLTSLNGQTDWSVLRDRAEQMLHNLLEQQLPETVEVVGSAITQADTLVAEDKLADALLRENEAANNSLEESGLDADAEKVTDATQENPVEEKAQVNASEETAAENPVIEKPQELEEPTGQQTVQNVQAVASEDTTPVEQEPIQQNTETDTSVTQTDGQAFEQQLTAYTICPGDTLTAISIRNYGSDTKVDEICEMNRIANPNDIKVGEKILLP